MDLYHRDYVSIYATSGSAESPGCLVDLLGDLLRKVEPIDGSHPLPGKNEPPYNVHREHGCCCNSVLLANEEWCLVPRYAQLGTNGNAHPPIAKDPAPKVSDQQSRIDESLQA